MDGGLNLVGPKTCIDARQRIELGFETHCLSVLLDRKVWVVNV